MARKRTSGRSAGPAPARAGWPRTWRPPSPALTTAPRWVLPGWFRFILWLAYHAGDAVAIYALATLFNRHKDEGDGGVGGGGSNTLLEVVWAPVLLIHLGGNDGVTAYNIEDNELWSRHLLTAVSQVTVAVYVFCKSWPPGGDKKLLAAAILLFVVGVVKCLAKALAFKRASIYSLVSSADGSMYNKLEKYVKDARDIVRQQAEDQHQVMEDPVATTSGIWAVEVMKRALVWARRLSSSKDEGTVTTTTSRSWVAKEMMKRALASLFPPRGLSSSKDETAEGSSNHPRSRRLRGERAEARNNDPTRRRQEKERLFEERGEASKLFVDLSSSYPHRISIFQKFWGLKDERAYDSVRGGLASAFFLLYTKLKTALPEDSYKHTGNESVSRNEVIRICIQGPRTFLPWASIALFHHSHREAYNGIDVKVTYAILCCTAVLEAHSSVILFLAAMHTSRGPQGWPETVHQYSLAGYFVRNKKHSILRKIVSCFQCKDFVDQLWCMEPCFTSARITYLVLGYLKDGWNQKIENAATYRSFNNHSNWGLNMNRPFDECVLLWHLTTDFWFFSSSFPDHKCAFAEPPTRETLIRLIYRVMVQGKSTSVANNPTSTTSGPQCSQESAKCKAVQCRQMSNYMVYLLFVNPEMLLPGSRRNLFKTAYDELKNILKDWEWNPVCWSRCTPCGVKLIKEEAIVMDKLIKVMQNKKSEKKASQEETSKEAISTDIVITVTQEKSERSSQEESSMEGSNRNEKFIDQAWDLAQSLSTMDEMERWQKIQNVWVQMLCYSASRCRGYLHAKALGKGGEFLSYVWLLLFNMGMETFSERLQRELLPSCQGNNDMAPQPTSEVCTTSTASSASMAHPRAGAGTTASTS